MKQIIQALCLGLIFISFKTSAQTVDDVVFSGKIANPTNHELILYDVNNKKKTIKIDDTGHFEDTISIDFIGHHRYYDGKKRVNIFFEKGKNLHISYDAQDLKHTISFSGQGAAVNNYILRKEAIKASHEEKLMADSINVFDLNEADFIETYRSLKTALMKELTATPGLPHQYKKLEARNINYEYLFFLSQYGMVQVNHLNKKNFQASKELNNELKDLVFTNEEDFQFSEMYRNIIQLIYYEKAGKKSEAEGIPRDIANLELISTIDNAFIRNYLLYKFAAGYLNYSDDIDGFYQAFMKGSSNEKDKAEITKMYQTVKRVEVNSASPKFENYENYAGGTLSLDDFKGKYVFIDIWATWCGPCIYEFPFLDSLEQSYKNKNIQFVTLSVDTKANRQKWRDFVKEKDLDGVQLLANDAFNSEFIKAYNITGIPRFLIIDPKGNIVSKNAPRPSDPQLKILLDSLPL